MKKVHYGFLLILVAFVLHGCTDPDNARSVLKSQGYTGIEMTGYNLLECAEGDIYHTGFSAVAPSGARVRGTVCAGIFKGSTVRYE